MKKTVKRPLTPLREAKLRNEHLIRYLHAHAVVDQISCGSCYASTYAEQNTLRLLRKQREVLNRIQDPMKGGPHAPV